MDYQEYPRWVDVDGPGHPQSPGRVLVNNEREEAEALKANAGPAYLNPPPDPGQKTIDDMDRAELVATLTREGIPDEMSDDDIRNAIRKVRERKAEMADDAADQAREDRERIEAGGDHGDGLQHAAPAEAKQPEPLKDADGKEVAPDTAQEANNDTSDQRRQAFSKANPGNDARPKDAQAKLPTDRPANSQVDAALTPGDKRKGPNK